MQGLLDPLPGSISTTGKRFIEVPRVYQFAIFHHGLQLSYTESFSSSFVGFSPPGGLPCHTNCQGVVVEEDEEELRTIT